MRINRVCKAVLITFFLGSLFMFPAQTHAVNEWNVTDIDGSIIYGEFGVCELANLRTSKGHFINQTGCSANGQLDFRQPIPNGSFYVEIIGPGATPSKPFHVLNGELTETPFQYPSYPEILPSPSMYFYGYSERVLYATPFHCNPIDYDVYNQNKQVVSHVATCRFGQYVLENDLPDNGVFHVFANRFNGIINNEIAFIQDYSGNFYMVDGVFYDHPPVFTPELGVLPDQTIEESSTYSQNGSFTDDGSTSWETTVDYGDGSGVQPLALTGKNFTLSHFYKDDGVYTVTISVTDNQGNSDTATVLVTVTNAAPVINLLTAPPSPTSINTSLEFSVRFSDKGILDTHVVTWNWGDGTTSTTTVPAASGLRTIPAEHTYQTGGVHDVTVTITDSSGDQASTTYSYMIIYDPNAGAVNGKTTYNSPVGSYVDNPTLTGNAEFEFDVEYDSATATIVSNKFNFSFPAANLIFEPTSFTWLAVNDNKTTFRVAGNLNGQTGYTMLVSVLDEQDQIRVQIRNLRQRNRLIYDTQKGAPDTADPTLPVAKGKIKIQ